MAATLTCGVIVSVSKGSAAITATLWKLFPSIFQPLPDSMFMVGPVITGQIGERPQ